MNEHPHDFYIAKINTLIASDREDLIAAMVLDFDRAREGDALRETRPTVTAGSDTPSLAR